MSANADTSTSTPNGGRDGIAPLRQQQVMTAATLQIALVGNPNCGKTALFNLLTGTRQKVANSRRRDDRAQGRSLHRAVGRQVRVLESAGGTALPRRVRTKRSRAT